MSFAGFSTLVAIAGAFVLAALLYALHRLKARRRLVRLPAMALWRQALAAEPARSLGGRFRQWPAYLLALAIALLLWFAAAHPVVDPVRRGGTQIFYLDASALLKPGDDAAQAKRALLADVRAVPTEARAVYLGDAAGTRLLGEGESVSLLSRRLAAVEAGARPSTFPAWVDIILPRLGNDGATLHYYGGWPAVRDVVRRLPPSVRVRYGYLADPVVGNRGIVALGVTPAASGRWGLADVGIGVVDTTGRAITPADLAWTLDGRAFAPARVMRIASGTFVAPDVAATGGLLTVRLTKGDGFAADDAAGIRLPDRRPIRVALAAGVPAIVRDVVRADDAFALSAAKDAQVIVRRDDEAGMAAIPALVLSSPARTPQAFVFAGPELDRPDAARIAQGGLAQIDAAALADRLHRPIAVDTRPAPRREVFVWAAILSDEQAARETAAVPLFVARSLRWLAGADGWIPYAKAGAALPDRSRFDGLAPSAPLAGAGTERIAGRAIAVSLVDRATTVAAGERAPRPAVTPLSGNGPPDRYFVLLVALAGLLLAVEWWLVQRGRMA